MLDLPGLSDALQAILSKADVFMPSGPELFLFTEAKDEAGAINELLERGIKAIILKRGSDGGASYFDRNGRIDQSAYRVDEIDQPVPETASEGGHS